MWINKYFFPLPNHAIDVLNTIIVDDAHQKSAQKYQEHFREIRISLINESQLRVLVELIKQPIVCHDHRIKAGKKNNSLPLIWQSLSRKVLNVGEDWKQNLSIPVLFWCMSFRWQITNITRITVADAVTYLAAAPTGRFVLLKSFLFLHCIFPVRKSIFPKHWVCIRWSKHCTLKSFQASMATSLISSLVMMQPLKSFKLCCLKWSFSWILLPNIFEIFRLVWTIWYVYKDLV